MNKKVIIIGGGIAGLAAGVYAQKCGFEVTVLESHHTAGGNCTSWKRGEYLFEGGMHWLSGSSEKSLMNKLWRHIGALDDNVKIHYREPFYEYDYQGEKIKIYRNVDATQKYLLELSPADATNIKELCDNIRKVKNLEVPIKNVRGVKSTNNLKTSAASMVKMLPAVHIMTTSGKIARDEYISRWKHDGIREMLSLFISEEHGVFPFFFTLGVVERGDGGFPEGGSLPFVERIVNTFQQLGGQLLLKTPAERVIIENNKAIGVIAKGEHMKADAIIIAADTMQISHLFEDGKLPESPWLEQMQAKTEAMSCIHASFGINADLSAYGASYMFKTKKPIVIKNSEVEPFEYIAISNYAEDRSYSPLGKTAITVAFNSDTYDFWKAAQKDGQYVALKKKVAAAIIEEIEEKIPETRGKIEVIDIATPLTYERYCGNWRGGWMSQMKPGMKISNYPPTITGLHGLYFAGQRMQPPGGLPVCLTTARTAVQQLCKDTKTVFEGEG